jgi:hypothetical protein
MPKIRMKVIQCDKDSNSIIVAFASENSKKPIEECQQLAFQPTLFDDPTDSEAVLRQIAKAGIVNVQEEEKQDEFFEKNILEEKYSQYVGQELSYDIDDLLSDDEIIVEEMVNEYSELEQILADIAAADEMAVEDEIVDQTNELNQILEDIALADEEIDLEDDS